MTAEQNLFNRIKHLIAATALWAVVFALALKFTQNWTSIPTPAGMFISAVILISLAISIVSGFSRLKLFRTHFLAIGALGLIAVFLLAKPLVKRTDYVSQSSDAICESFLVTAQTTPSCNTGEQGLAGFPKRSIPKLNPELQN